MQSLLKTRNNTTEFANWNKPGFRRKTVSRYCSGKADGSYKKLLGKLARTGLLIIDDWGLEKINTSQRYDLMEMMDDRYGENSTVMIITSGEQVLWHHRGQNSCGYNP